MARLPRLYLPGCAQHVVQRGNNREACFYEETDYKAYLSSLKDSAAKYRVAVHAFVLMTNHVHLLVTPGDAQGVGRMMQALVANLAAAWREQLMDIGWFMRLLNEHIARQANGEDQCAGRFWEGRFKSQALLDEKALAACLAYVDLNPIRAKMADRPEASDYTSAQKRFECAKSCDEAVHAHQPSSLLPFVGNRRQNMPAGLPFRLQDYLELLDWTGRQLRADKRGAIDSNLPPILARLNIDPKNWLYTASHFERAFKGFVGTVQSLVSAVQALGYQRTPGLTAGQLLS